MTIKRKLMVLFTLLAAVIIAATTLFTNILSVSANSDYAAIKGFNIEGLYYSDDKTLNSRPIVNGAEKSIGNMSLWVGRYNLYDSKAEQMYVGLFIEAKICANDNSARNSQMEIDVYHVDKLCSNVVVYYPEEESGGSVTESSGIEFGFSEGNAKFGFSFSNASTYSEIDLRCYPYDSHNGKEHSDKCTPNGEPTGVKFVFDWYNPGGQSIKAPYHGEIVKRLAVVFDVDMDSNPGFDTDFNTFVVDYTADIYSKTYRKEFEENITMSFNGRGVSVN